MPTKQPTRSVGQTNCIALDLGENAIRAVEMELSGSGDATANRVLRKGSAPLPANVWHDLASNRDAFINALRGALSAAGIAGRSVVACMPRRLVTVRFARLPSAPPEQMKSMVMFEAQQYILFSLDEVMLDYHTLTGPLPGFGVTDGDDMETVLLVAARRSLVNELLAIFDKAGLELRQLSASALALSEHARDVLEPTALIDIQPGSMDVAVVSDGKLLFTRATALDLEGIDPEVAQRKLDEEVARSFTAYQNEFRSKVLSHVYLSGSSATVRDAGRLEKSLSAILDMPVSRLHNRLIPAADPEVIGYATAVGMALQTQPNGLVPISLVPDERAERRARQSRQIKQRLSLVGAAAVLIVTTMYAKAVVADHEKTEKLTIDANKKLKASKAALAVVQGQHDKLESFDTELDKGLDRRHGTVDIVTALHSALPPTSDLWLTQLSYARGDVRGGLITMRGESKNSIAPTDLVIALQACGAFRDVKLGYMGDAQETNLVAAPAAPKAAEEAPAEAAPLPNFPGSGGPGTGQFGYPGNAFPGGGNGFPQGGPNGFPNFPQGGGNGFPQGGGGVFPQGGGNGFTPGGGSGFRPGGQPGGQPIQISPTPQGGGGQPNIQFIPNSTPPDGGGIAPPAPAPIIIQPSPQVLNDPAPSKQSAGQPIAGRAAGKPTVIYPDDSPESENTRSSKAKPRQRPGMGGASAFSPTTVMTPAAAYRMSVAPSTRITTPRVTIPRRASSIPVTKPTTGAVKPPGSNKVTRTSFIITCRVNQNSADLLAGLTLTTPKSAHSGTGTAKTKKSVTSAASDGSDDTGDSDAN